MDAARAVQQRVLPDTQTQTHAEASAMEEDLKLLPAAPSHQQKHSMI